MSENDKLMAIIGEKDTWFQIFDMIRIIEPGGTHRVLYYRGNEEFDIKNPCFDFWHRSEHCANCVSKRACIEKNIVMKFEYRNNAYYLVLAKPVMYKNESYILELVLNISDQMLSDSEGIEMKDFVVDIVDRLEKASTKESFTDLYNKPHMMEVYSKYKRAGKSAIYMALLDIDDFKLVNDIYGHDLGDQAILTIADMLRAEFVELGSVARFGGDEFGIIFNSTDGDDYKQRLDRMKYALDHTLYECEGKKFYITVSYGIAEVSNTDAFSDAIHLVDKELYYAKRRKIIDQNRVE